MLKSQQALQEAYKSVIDRGLSRKNRHFPLEILTFQQYKQLVVEQNEIAADKTRTVGTSTSHKRKKKRQRTDSFDIVSSTSDQDEVEKCTNDKERELEEVEQFIKF